MDANLTSEKIYIYMLMSNAIHSYWTASSDYQLYCCEEIFSLSLVLQSLTLKIIHTHSLFLLAMWL